MLSLSRNPRPAVFRALSTVCFTLYIALIASTLLSTQAGRPNENGASWQQFSSHTFTPRSSAPVFEHGRHIIHDADAFGFGALDPARSELRTSIFSELSTSHFTATPGTRMHASTRSSGCDLRLFWGRDVRPSDFRLSLQQQLASYSLMRSFTVKHVSFCPGSKQTTPGSKFTLSIACLAHFLLSLPICCAHFLISSMAANLIRVWVLAAAFISCAGQKHNTRSKSKGQPTKAPAKANARPSDGTMPSSFAKRGAPGNGNDDDDPRPPRRPTKPHVPPDASDSDVELVEEDDTALTAEEENANLRLQVAMLQSRLAAGAQAHRKRMAPSSPSPPPKRSKSVNFAAHDPPSHTLLPSHQLLGRLDPNNLTHKAIKRRHQHISNIHGRLHQAKAALGHLDVEAAATHVEGAMQDLVLQSGELNIALQYGWDVIDTMDQLSGGADLPAQQHKLLQEALRAGARTAPRSDFKRYWGRSGPMVSTPAFYPDHSFQQPPPAPGWPPYPSMVPVMSFANPVAPSPHMAAPHGMPGHGAPRAPPPPGFLNIVCHKCFGVGHIAKNCRNTQAPPPPHGGGPSMHK